MDASFTGMLSLAGTIIVSFGGGAAIVFVLSRWLGRVWAERIIEKLRQHNQQELEMLVRRRDVYSKLATSLRVFLKRTDDLCMQQRFLEAYDEASVWAPDPVMNTIGMLLDLIHNHTVEKKGSIADNVLRTAYAACMTEIRKDAGFPATTFSYRMVSF